MLSTALSSRNFALSLIRPRANNGTEVDVGFKTEYPYVPLDVTKGDLILGSMIFGSFFGLLVAAFWTAVLETRRAKKLTLYVFMIWLEISANIVFALVTWVYLAGYLSPGLHIFAVIIACWICQVQCLLQIIANRLSILIHKQKYRVYLKLSIAVVFGCISIVTACIWIPAQLQINHVFVNTNHWWDRFEKGCYLLIDLMLNALFIRIVKKRLVDHGLRNYDKVMRFNQYMIIISIGMDILLIGVTTLRNPIVYCQFHPVAYIVKLQVEMTMAQLIVNVARSTGIHVLERPSDKTPSKELTHLDTSTHTNSHDYMNDGGTEAFDMQNRDRHQDRKFEMESHSRVVADSSSDLVFARLPV